MVLPYEDTDAILYNVLHLHRKNIQLITWSQPDGSYLIGRVPGVITA